MCFHTLCMFSEIVVIHMFCKVICCFEQVFKYCSDEVFRTVIVQVVVFWVVTLCSLVTGYHQFEGHDSFIFMVEVILTQKMETAYLSKH
jgi:hypothetical protein